MKEKAKSLLRRLCVALSGVALGSWMGAFIWLFMTGRIVLGCIFVGVPFAALLVCYVLFGED